ncbi:hypothetical protein IGI49_001313 [Enterococcus sp. AZ071]
MHEDLVLEMTYYTVNAGIVYLFFVVNTAIRSQGYGQQIMQGL